LNLQLIEVDVSIWTKQIPQHEGKSNAVLRRWKIQRHT
jgi:hypothetical protein